MNNRIKHQEKSGAQGECSTFLNTIGVGTKNVDGQYYRSGVPDYDVSIPNGNNQPIATLVEVKAGGLMFPFYRIEDNQWAYTDFWQKKSGGTAWFWLLVGTEAVNAIGPFRRVTYLIPRNELWEAYLLLMSETGGEQQVLPMNKFVPRIRNKAWYADNNLYIDTLFRDYRMDRIPGVGWWPHPEHSFLKMYSVEAQQHERQLELFGY